MTKKPPAQAPRERMSDVQFEAVLRELRRLTLIGSVAPFFEAGHVQVRPELQLGSRSERIQYHVQMRQSLTGTTTTPRTGPDTRRNMRTSRS